MGLSHLHYTSSVHMVGLAAIRVKARHAAAHVDRQETACRTSSVVVAGLRRFWKMNAIAMLMM